MTLQPLAAWIAASTGWRRTLIAFLAGAASVLAIAPFHLWPVLFLTLPPAIWLIDGSVGSARRRMRRAAVDGWWFGFGYFLAGLWWIGAAFLVEADIFGWLLPVAVLGMPAGLALFTALGFAAAAAAWLPTPWRILAFALALGMAEFVRGTVLTGFPWNAFGYALADQEILGQAASVVGVEGLTFLALLIFAAPAALASGIRPASGPLILAGSALALLAVFGAMRLGAAQTTFREQPLIRLVQPAVQQDAKFRPAAGPEILALYLGLSVPNPPLDAAPRQEAPESPTAGPETLLLWPESAFPFLIEREPAALAEIGAALPSGTTLLTGAARIDAGGSGRPSIYNSLLEISEAGQIVESYDKVHLVPFGEYLPLQGLLERLGLQQLVRLPGGFAAGRDDQHNMLAAGLRLRPLICYEAVFTAEAARGERPDAFLNITNDAWFGDTPGPYQHYAMSKVRSIEQGLPLVRVANSGISAIVDPYGRVLQYIGLGRRAVLVGPLPNALQPTIYARFGRTATLSLVILLAIAYFRARRTV